VEALLILVALAVAALVLFGGLSGGRDGEKVASAALAPLPSALDLAPSPPTLATTVPRRVPLHIYTGPPARVHAGALPPPGGDQYTLALARQPNGRWASVLHGSDVKMEGGVLTVTLVVPWAELAERFTAVNLVVR
jgi:hypothetical protein